MKKKDIIRKNMMIKLITMIVIFFITSSLYSNNLIVENFKSQGLNFSGMAMSKVSLTSNEMPNNFYLGQNSPNPFNSATNIYFSVPSRQNIKIVVMDVFGKEIDLITNGVMDLGIYKAEFDASGLSSGVYFYKIQAENYFEIKKMTLVK